MLKIKSFNLILIRHGESKWNLENKFTGWKDVDLTFKGIKQAINLAKILKKNNIYPDYIYTSELKRAIKTSEIIKKKLKINNQIQKNWRLNERSYGSLEGKERNYIKNKYYLEYSLFKNNIYLKPYVKKYFNINSESIIDTQNRFIPFWYKYINPKIKDNCTIFIISHKNQIKSILHYLKLNYKIEINNCQPIIISIHDNKYSFKIL